MKSYYILKPKNLNLEYLITKYTPDFKSNIDFAYLIIHFVIMYQNDSTNMNSVRLSSTYLQKFNRIYNKHIRFLIENYPNDGAVLRGTKYSKGKPYGYKLPKFYFNCDLEIYEIKDAVLLRKMNHIFPQNKTNENVRTYYYFLLKFFKSNKLTVYEPSLLMEQLNNMLDKKKSLRNAKNILKTMNQQFRCSLNTKKDGRVHSNITQLSKIARNHLQYDGEFLAEVDISSAVPYFLFITMDSYLNNNLVYIHNNFQYNNTITYMLDEISGDIEKSDVYSFGKSIIERQIYQQFADMIFNEDFYSSKGFDFEKVMEHYNHYFKKQFGYNFDGDCADQLKFAKKRMLSMLFASTSIYKYEQSVFGSLFPKVLKFINEFKNVQQYKEDENLKCKKT